MNWHTVEASHFSLNQAEVLVRRVLLAAVTMLLATGCFHATIETGLPAGTDVVTKPWAHAFVYGLVPPATVETAAKCKNGAAKVETQISFLNGLVAALTWSLYTPMTITVTCASSTKMATMQGAAEGMTIRAKGDTPNAQSAAMSEAIAASVRTGQPALVIF